MADDIDIDIDTETDPVLAAALREHARLVREQAKAEQARIIAEYRAARTSNTDKVLAGPSPSPAKRVKAAINVSRSSKPKRLFGVESTVLEAEARLAYMPSPKESELEVQLERERSRQKRAGERRGVQRSTAFDQTPAITSTSARSDTTPDDAYTPIRNERNDDLTVVHNLQHCPVDYTPPADDPLFLKYEPNSGTRLRDRKLPHEDLQEYLSARYFVSPEMLYALVRTIKGGTEYEMPLEGDWVLIGVLAEKSEIRMTGSGSALLAKRNKTLSREEKTRLKDKKEAMKALDVDGEAASDDELKAAASSGDEAIASKAAAATPAQRRYISFKLLDMRNKNAGGGAGILALKLFEADPKHERVKKAAESDEEIVTKTGVRMRKEKKLYRDDGKLDVAQTTSHKGGSGGAYEKFWKERNGTVVAILNPRLMKPWTGGFGQGSNANVIALTPESAESMVIIGRSEDLGSCQAMKKDGQLCGAWCDLRSGTACEYHVQQAIKNRRAARPEFYAGTSGMNTTSTSANFDKLTSAKNGHRKVPNGQYVHAGNSTISSSRSINGVPYDPENRYGLLPPAGAAARSLDGTKTYVVASTTQPGIQGTSHALRNRRNNMNGVSRASYVDAPKVRGEVDPKERAKRREREESQMCRILQRDGGNSLGAKYLARNGTVKTVPGRDDSETADQSDHQPSEAVQDGARKRVFNVAAMRRIGFDPTSASGDQPKAKKMKNDDALKALENPSKNVEPKLNRPPGEKVRSGVTVPPGAQKLSKSRRRPHQPEAVDDWDELDAEHTRRSFLLDDGGDAMHKKPKADPGFLWSSDDEGEDQYLANADADSDDDLEIEPPA